MSTGEDHVLVDNSPSATHLGPSILSVDEEAADNFSNSPIRMFVIKSIKVSMQPEPKTDKSNLPKRLKIMNNLQTSSLGL
jgi:hypothetical protein